MPLNESLTRKNRNQNLNDFESTQPVPEPVEEDTIDLRVVFTLIKKYWLLMISIILICGCATGIYTKLFIPKTYSSSGSLFLTPKIVEGTVDYTSLNSNAKLVDNVLNLITQENIMNTVAHETGLEDSSKVREALSVANTPNTEIITVTATTTDAKLSKDIATETIDEFIATMTDSLNVKNIQVTDTPKLNYTPVGPSLAKNIVIGAMIGVVIDAVFIGYKLLTDKRLTTREDAEKFLGLPVYAQLPDLETRK